VTRGADGIWRRGDEKDWEPVPRAGVVQFVSDDQVFIETAGGLVQRSAPAGTTVAVGNIVTFDSRPSILSVAVPPKSLRTSLLSDDFDVASVRTTPTSLAWSDFAGFPELVREAEDLTAVHTNASTRDKLTAMGSIRFAECCLRVRRAPERPSSPKSWPHSPARRFTSSPSLHWAGGSSAKANSDCRRSTTMPPRNICRSFS